MDTQPMLAMKNLRSYQVADKSSLQGMYSIEIACQRPTTKSNLPSPLIGFYLDFRKSPLNNVGGTAK